MTMKTNLEKWNHYLSIINDKTKKFIDSQLIGKKILDKYYAVDQNGKIVERIINGIDYSHYKHGGKIYFYGKKPTNGDIIEIAKYAATDIPFTIENIWFSYSEIENKITSSVNFIDILNQKHLFYDINDAIIYSFQVIKEMEEENEFRKLHQKDSNYNYNANGYKFLGWQNGWKHEYFDVDGNLCSVTGKPHKSFGYPKENYPEYRNCIDSKHRRIEVNHNQRGSENTVSCPLCKIYWKYDSSD